MVEQNLCPNCGEPMDLGNVFISGKAICPNCGYQGVPAGKTQYIQRAKKVARQEPMAPVADDSDPLDLRGLSAKITIICAGMLVLSVATPGFSALLPVSAIGALMFGASYAILGRKG